ncbi:peroxiredoxin isoform X2 [Nilaparvata lugens]|uniref:peroxiredoxin isoform X2 n=1 Tax=Nilaparvata lugens TaxID=108931 RepID=UPI00193E878B|nr:peroxiredoxin isoform X2 [Nilaparvata lugens]
MLVKKRRVLPFKPKRFRPEWMMYDMFKDWLRPHPNPENAMCAACDSVIKAGKSELEKHAAGKKHLKNLSVYRKEIGLPDDDVIVIGGAPTHEMDESVGSGTTFMQTSSNELGPEANPTFSLEPTGAFGVEGGVQVQASAAAPRLPKPPQEATVYVSKAFVTKPAPPWKATAIVNGHVTRLELNDYKGRYVILFFYPQDFAAVCPTEILALSDRVSEFRALQTEIVACSVDSHLTHLTWCRMARSDGGLANPKIPLLADPTHSISRDYGVLMPDVGHSLRAHFIIDRRGTIRHMCVNDMSVGRSVDELLRMVQALQHVDEHEAGCPADWKPGQPSV